MKLKSSLRKRKCKSFKEFCKIKRKYSKYFCFWQGNQWQQFRWRLNNLWFTWIEYHITSIDELYAFQKWLNKPFNRLYDNTFLSVINKTIENYGKTYKYGKLIGVSVTNEDFYWIFENENANRRLYSSGISIN